MKEGEEFNERRFRERDRKVRREMRRSSEEERMRNLKRGKDRKRENTKSVEGIRRSNEYRILGE